ncbi:hypothetical protein HYC85_020741 [Camellia sinensis]|uniref:Pectate lyase n=1 Tax=Camellia sinensis TaxID=4442 RepID=A0A7J7GQN6_CAMSI|nr:hypothetical protein HYC85_020741 [Camellia sinensis]
MLLSILALGRRAMEMGFQIFLELPNIWIDHVSMSNYVNGLVDAIEGSTGITISNSHFTDHNKVMLFRAHDSTSKDKIMQVMIAFNHFGNRLIQRMTRCQWGFIHVINNDYTH